MSEQDTTSPREKIMNYRDRYTQTVQHDGIEYTLKSQNGCFWDVWVKNALVMRDFTNLQNALHGIRNGIVKSAL